MSVGTLFSCGLLFLFMLPIISGITFFILSFNWLVGKKAIFFLFLACILFNIEFLLVMPVNGVDIERYFGTIAEMRLLPNLHALMSFWEFNLQYERTNWLFTLFEWLISRTPYSTLLPFVTTSLCSFFTLYPFFDIAQKYPRNKKTILFFALVIFFLIGYGWMASTSRWGLAVTSVLFSDYIFFIKLDERKRFCWILFLPILFHIGSLVEIIFALYVSFIKKTSLFKTILIIVPIWFYLQYVSTKVSVNDGSIASQLGIMTNVYSKGVGKLNLNGSITMYIVYVVVLLISFIVLYDIHIVKRLGPDNYSKSIILLFQLNFLLVLTLIGKTDIFNRFIILPAIFGALYEGLNRKNCGFVRCGIFITIFTGAFLYEIIMIKQFQFVLSPIHLFVANIYTILSNIQRY
ncbi:hypothetical protein [Lactiplantibacillus plantarum]|uniref:hypothetical protein n=1 Tax=Lactiplantibacillus plantarum TaxID=1590 RepID=UPI003F52CE7A